MSNWEQTGLACPCGKSSDAYCLDKEGKGYCYGQCGGTLFRNGVEKKREDMKVSSKYFPDRGLTSSTLKVYNVQTHFLDDEPYKIGFPYPKVNEVEVFKIRNLMIPKGDRGHFMSSGPISKAGLFGMDKFPAGSKKSITITEGEYDAMSVYQISDGHTAGVSIASSATAKRDIKENWDYINSFKKIIFAFDKDLAGGKALEEVVSSFDFKKVYVCDFQHYKDANDYLQNGKYKELYETWVAAKKHIPKGIINGFPSIKALLSERGVSQLGTYPLPQLQLMLKGLHAGEFVLIKGMEGLGKQLANTTQIPTVDGWTTMGEIKVGDIILGADGKPTNVTYVTEDQLVDNYEVKFNDGTSVVAGGPHKWGVITQSNAYRVKTTDQIISEGVICKNNASRYSVPIMKPMELPEKDLPINPYWLGYWLGDGHSYSADISVCKKDFIDWDKTNVRFSRDDKTCTSVRVNEIVYYGLSSNNLIKNKHIPKDYLRGSIAQRRELLKGLMDSDGSATKYGACEFYTSSEKLKDGFLELARSLGYACRLRTKQSKLYGVNKKLSYTISFRSDNGYDVFKLERKAIKVSCTEKTRLTKKSITSITKVPTVKSRCITVDNKDHLYVCDKGWTVTHNTEIFRLMEDHLLKTTEYPIGIIHLEENTATTIKAIATYHTQEPMNVEDQGFTIDQIYNAYLDAVKNNEDRVYFQSSKGNQDEQTVMDNMRFLAAICGCKFIFFDHISWLAASTEDGEDERKKLDRIVVKIKELAEELGITIIAISHVNDQGQTRGSRYISKMADTVINLTRDLKSTDEDERKTLHIYIEKARTAGATEGPAGSAIFDVVSNTLKVRVPVAAPIN